MSNASGKFVIIGILAVAIVSAGISWWYRYSATHRAVQFWGPEGSQLIRDAPHVSLMRFFLSTPPTMRDISKAPGMTHLRNALLEDRSFQWARVTDAAPKSGGWKLEFSDPASGQQVLILFTTDCRGAALLGQSETKLRLVSTEPIAKSLCEVFAELTSESSEPKR